MKRNQIRIVVILGAFAIIGITIIQSYWLIKAWDINEKQFNQTIFIGLKNVAEKLSTYNQTVMPNENPVNQLSSNYFVVNVNSVIDANILDYYLKSEFNLLNIDIDYEYAIYDCHDDKMVYGNYVPAKGKSKSLKMTSDLPKYEEYTYYFGVNFPSKTNYIGSDMLIWLIFSAILLISVIFFGYAIFIILQQKRLSELQKDFINNMTHEFKTPLSSIRISADVIGNSAIKNNPERLKTYSNIIMQESDRLNKQVENVLQIAKFEKMGSDIKPEDLELCQLIENVIDNCRANHENATITKAFSLDEIYIRADKLHTTNIISNLLDNALKYADKKPEISILLEKKSYFLEVAICDNGPGIAKEYQKKIFRKFFRIPTGNIHNIKGFGLGLSYVWNVCKAQNWKIKLKSEVGKGSVFTIQIPLK